MVECRSASQAPFRISTCSLQRLDAIFSCVLLCLYASPDHRLPSGMDSQTSSHIEDVAMSSPDPRITMTFLDAAGRVVFNNDFEVNDGLGSSQLGQDSGGDVAMVSLTHLRSFSSSDICCFLSTMWLRLTCSGCHVPLNYSISQPPQSLCP